MGFGSLLGGASPQVAAGEAVGAAAGKVLTSVGDLALKIRQAIKGKELDPETAARLEQLAVEAEAARDLAQMAVNQVEAASSSVFVAGWRPAVGWVCVVSLAAYYPPRFIAATTLWIIQVWNSGAWITPPEVGITDILGLVGSMLGMSWLRTQEKKAGVAAGR